MTGGICHQRNGLLVPAVRPDRDESVVAFPTAQHEQTLVISVFRVCPGVLDAGQGTSRARRHPRRCSFFVERFMWRQAETVGARPVSIVVGKDRPSVVPNKRASSSSAS